MSGFRPFDVRDGSQSANKLTIKPAKLGGSTSTNEMEVFPSCPKGGVSALCYPLSCSETSSTGLK